MLDEEFPSLTVERLFQLLQPLPGERLLEIGPGTGLFSLPVARALQPYGHLTVFDIQQLMLEHTLARAAAEQLTNIDAARGDACRLPFADASFGGAFLVTVLGETRDRRACLNELARVLRPGGRLVVGEFMIDWHAVRLPTLIRCATAGGLAFEQRLGSRLGYFAAFTKTPPTGTFSRANV